MLPLYVFHIRYISIYKTHGKCVSGNSQTTKCTSQWIVMNYIDLKENKEKYINLVSLEHNFANSCLIFLTKRVRSCIMI